MKYLIKNVDLINEGERFRTDILIEDGRFKRIDKHISINGAVSEINGESLIAIPGLIDDQVHFREPGLTHKGEIYTEARAAVAGGVTSFMEMPNTKPPAVTVAELEKKYSRAAHCALANYSFFMGTTNHNFDELQKINKEQICGVKIFMGSSTGDMLVDNEKELERVFTNIDKLIATHCEYDPLVNANLAKKIAEYGDDIPIWEHPNIRSREACFQSSSFAVDLAKRTQARLHILHISTAEELALFDNQTPLKDKRITAEACTHHLWFSEEDYASKGTLIKWNPAVKKASDRTALWEAVNNGKIDVLATDHAPHTRQEKANVYTSAPSGGPLIQHTLQALLQKEQEGQITLERIVQLASHIVATLFGIVDRGFVREGNWADLVLVDREKAQTVSPDNILYKCGWSPFEGETFSSSIHSTFVNGHLVYNQGTFDESQFGQRMLFNR